MDTFYFKDITPILIHGMIAYLVKTRDICDGGTGFNAQ